MSDLVHAYWSAATKRRNERYAQIAEMYDVQHKGFNEIRSELGCGSETIKDALAAHGIAIRCAHRCKQATPTIAQEDALLIARFESETAAVAAMLADVLPAGAKVRVKSFSHLCAEVRDAVCPYCRAMIRFPHCGRRIQGETMEGSQFGANHCGEGDCATWPGAEREAAFREYVAYRKRQWAAFSGLDTKIAHARSNMESAHETVLTEVQVGGA
jgi:hypothetical protein